MAKRTTTPHQQYPGKTLADTRLEITWINNDEYAFWRLARLELFARIQRLKRHTLANRPFSDSEIDSRRRKALNASRAPDPPPSTRLAKFVHRLMGYLPLRLNTTSETQTAEPIDPVAIAAANPLSLFSADEVSAKLRPQRLRLQRTFRHQMVKISQTFREYLQWVALLPEEDVDEEIAELKQRYVQIGRQREWYVAFMLMTERVVRESKFASTDFGMNEPSTRILQQDFLQTMKSRFSSYWRLHELRAYCYKHELFREIAKIERLQNDLTGDTLIRAPVEFTRIEALIDELEKGIKAFQHHKKSRSEKQQPVPAKVDHAKRLEDWRQFKHLLEQSFTPINTLLTELKDIVRHNKGWQLEYQVFRALARVNRIEHTRTGKTTAIGRTETLKFVKEISSRIDREIATDVKFQQLRQHQGSRADQNLQAALATIQLDLTQRGIGALDDIHKTKEACVQQTNDGEPKIVPLFNQR